MTVFCRSILPVGPSLPLYLFKRDKLDRVAPLVADRPLTYSTIDTATHLICYTMVNLIFGCEEKLKKRSQSMILFMIVFVEHPTGFAKVF